MPFVKLHYPDPFTSFIDLQKEVKRTTPEMFNLYKLCITLHKTFNGALPESEWIGLNIEQTWLDKVILKL
jgi:hypothetical protein